MKLNYIALLTAVAMLNVAPTVVFAQNGGNDTGSATSSSEAGTAPSMGTPSESTGQAGSEMMPLQQQEAGSATDISGSAPSSTDGGTGSATGAQDKGSSSSN